MSVLLYAMSGVARAGATRSNVHSNRVFVSIDDVHYATGRAAEATRILVESLQITDNHHEEPTTGQCRAMGFTPIEGQTVVITLGSKNTLVREFGGQILRRQHVSLTSDQDNLTAHAYALSLIDWTWGMDKRTVSGYYTGSATTIAEELIAEYAPGYTSSVEAGLDTVTGGITFTNSSLTGALTQLCNRVGAKWLCDYFKVVRVYTVDTGDTNPTTLTATHASLRDFAETRDLSQVVTRVQVEGGGSVALTDVAPGETVIPVETAEWYDDAGGIVVSGPQRIAYTGRTEGGGGGLVGPGAQPSSAPAAAVVIGAGVETGAHDYGVTFVTGAGESLPGPVSQVTVGVTTPPSSAPSPGSATSGTGPDAGTHDYVATFVTAAGQTTPGVASTPVTVLAPVTKPTGITGWTPTTGGGLVDDGVYTHVVTFYTATGETDASTSTGGSIGAGNTAVVLYGIPVSGDARVIGRRIYRTTDGGATRKLVATISNNTTTTYTDTTADGSLGANVPTSNTTSYRTVPLTGIPLGPADVTSRKIYRRFNATGTYKLVATIADNTTTTYSDAIENASLGADAPTTNTATANQVALSAIPIGGASVTSRKVYRTVAGGAQLKLLATIADNTTTTYTDSTADASLGANTPSSDTSGLTQPEGQVSPGTTTIPVASMAGFSSSGGWALIGNGAQVVRYTGISGSALTGIPASGVGAIAAAIAYNSTITECPVLTGIPSSGTGAVQYQIVKGDDVNIFVTSDDVTAQTTLAALIGGDGIQEYYVQDRRLAKPEALARGEALLALKSSVDVGITYTSRDINTRSGRTITTSLGAPFYLSASFLIQTVTQSFTQTQPPTCPLYQVAASSNRLTFEQLLQMAQGR